MCPGNIYPQGITLRIITKRWLSTERPLYNTLDLVKIDAGFFRDTYTDTYYQHNEFWNNPR